MNAVRAYRFRFRTVSGLLRVLAAAAAVTLGYAPPLSASADYWDIFAPVDACAAQTETVEETIAALGRKGWEAVPDRFDLDPDVVNALTWTKAARIVIPHGAEAFDALARNGVTGGLAGFFAYARDRVMEDVLKQDTSVSVNRVLVRRRDGDLDVLLMSYRSPLGSMRQVLCLAGYGETTAEPMVEWVEAREGPLASRQEPQVSFQGGITPQGGIISGALKHFALNPSRLQDVPAEFTRGISGVVEYEVHFRVQEN